MTPSRQSTGKRARVQLPERFANCTVLIEEISDTEVRIRKLPSAPEEEFRFYEELVTPLSDHDRDIFLELLDNPPPASEAFRRAAQRFRHRDNGSS